MRVLQPETPSTPPSQPRDLPFTPVPVSLSPGVPQASCPQPSHPPWLSPSRTQLFPPPQVPLGGGCCPSRAPGWVMLPFQGPWHSTQACSAPQGWTLCPTTVRVLRATRNTRKAHSALGPPETGMHHAPTAGTGPLEQGWAAEELYCLSPWGNATVQLLLMLHAGNKPTAPCPCSVTHCPCPLCEDRTHGCQGHMCPGWHVAPMGSCLLPAGC